MKGTKLSMTRKRSKSKILTDRNQNDYSKQEVESEESPSSLVFQEIDMMSLNENELLNDFGMQASSISVPVYKSRRKVSELENENLGLYKSSENLNNKDDFVLFKRKPQVHPLGKNHFAQLSDEIMLYIFKMLPKTVLVKCSLVCKQWQELSYDETLWKRYDFGRRVIKPLTIEVLLKRRIQVLRLAMSEIRSPAFTDSYLHIYPWRSNLQYLDLSMAMIKTSDLAILLSKCFSLKKLSVEHCNLNEECCTYIAENAQLEVLNMAMTDGLTPVGMQAICVCCQNLKEWNLGWAKLTEECIDACFHLFPSTLRRLNLSGHRHVLTDSALIKVIERCQGLREVDVSDSAQISNVSIEILIKQCTHLQHLHTSRSYNIPTETNKLLKGLKNFKYLEIFQTLTDTALAALRDFLPEIKINQHMFSTIARPTVGIRRTSIWEVQTRDHFQ